MLSENALASDLVELLKLYSVVCSEYDFRRACVICDSVKSLFENDLDRVGEVVFDRSVVLFVVLFDNALKLFEKHRAVEPIRARVDFVDYLFGLCSFFFLNYLFELAVS